MKFTKLIAIVSITFSLSACVVASPSHRNYSGYDNNGESCTQVEEANGACEAVGKHHHKHHNYNTETGSGYKSADGITMLTREGKTLPACGEVGGSQADNGNSCWF